MVGAEEPHSVPGKSQEPGYWGWAWVDVPTGTLHVPLSTSPAMVEGRPALGSTAPHPPHAQPESLGKWLILGEP